MLEIIACLLQTPPFLAIELEMPPIVTKVHAEPVHMWDVGVRMAAIDVADKVAVVVGDESAAVGGGAEEIVKADNQTVRRCLFGECKGGEGNNGNVETHCLQGG